MSFLSSIFPSGPCRKKWAPEGEGHLLKQLGNTCQFLRGLRTQMRFGELSRAPLRIVRLQMIDEFVECDWLARSRDPWDAQLSRKVQQRHASLQTLRDAIDVRALFFDSLPEVDTAHFRVFRDSPEEGREMILTGRTERGDGAFHNIHSLVMRAKFLGFIFRFEDDCLLRLTDAAETVNC